MGQSAGDQGGAAIDRGDAQRSPERIFFAPAGNLRGHRSALVDARLQAAARYRRLAATPAAHRGGELQLSPTPIGPIEARWPGGVRVRRSVAGQGLRRPAVDAV